MIDYPAQFDIIDASIFSKLVDERSYVTLLRDFHLEDMKTSEKSLEFLSSHYLGRTFCTYFGVATCFSLHFKYLMFIYYSRM